MPEKMFRIGKPYREISIIEAFYFKRYKTDYGINKLTT